MTGTMCETLRHRMPEVRLGHAQWTEDEERHLTGCVECAAEWRLVQAASALGADAARAIDPAATARVVLERHRHGARVRAVRRRAAWAAGLVAVAAALLLAIGLGRSGPTVTPVATEVRLVPELDSLDTTELILVLDQLEAASPELLFEPGFESFDALESAELEDVLKAWEG